MSVLSSDHSQSGYLEFYNALIEQSRSDDCVSRLLLGINWSAASLENETGVGLCFSPLHIPRTNPWAGTLKGRSVTELAPWILQWDAAAAVVGSLVINAAINNRSGLVEKAQAANRDGPPHLAVFRHFRPYLKAKRVAVIGHYPGLEPFPEVAQWRCLERNVQRGDLPDSAAEVVLPEADWVFITASSIANKTLPRLLQLSAKAEVVLMGPSLPWMEGWQQFGVNHLAGVEVLSPEALWQVAEEGGGTRLFDEGCRYRVLSL